MRRRRATEEGREADREALKKYRESIRWQSTKARYSKSEARRQSQRRYKQSPKGRTYYGAYRAIYTPEYRATEKGKTALRKYRTSEKGMATHLRYRQSLKGREAKARAKYKRRAIEVHVVSTLTPTEWAEIKAAQDYKCAICGEVKPLTRDHIIPITKGGHHVKENIQALCHNCNSRKGNRSDGLSQSREKDNED